MSKDQNIGAAVLTISAVIGVFYVGRLFYPQWLNTLGIQITQSNVQFQIIAVPVPAAFVAVLGIGAWDRLDHGNDNTT